ncbi:MAG: PDZ domain-containing protein [Thermaerobacter sp.]|nr:PDZ domain-containing protein [Thermaerobacter sp.]
MEPTERFTVSFLEPGLHIYHVTLEVGNLPAGRHALSLPVWTPGSYEVRDFARHLFNLAVSADDTVLEVYHAAKNRWLFETVRPGAVRITYQVYAFDPGVSLSHLDQSHAFWNGAQLFLLVDEYKQLPIELEIQAPPGWIPATGLDRSPDHPGLFRAENYDGLIDSPVEVGTHRTLSFAVDGKPHSVVLWGQGNEDTERLAADIEQIVRTQGEMFGGLPYAHYTFILHLGDRGTGGLEHLNSTVCGIQRFQFRPEKNYRKVLSLIAHEFFHLWNVKRIHPDMLGPFDYNQETYVRLLWALEGFTDYYAYLTLRRAGLYTVNHYLSGLATRIKQYEAQPGRFVQSLSEASFDTWIKYYKRHADSPNRTISYYLKGDLVGTCLDLEIRQRTANRQSLDSVLKRLYQRYGQDGLGFPESVYQETVEEVGESSFEEFFRQYIHGVAPVPFEHYLAYAGLALERRYKQPASDRGPEDSEDVGEDERDKPVAAGETLPWLGIETTPHRHRATVSVSYTHGPARALLNPGDEIVALNGYQIAGPSDLAKRLRLNHRSGEPVEVAFFRRGRLETASIVLADAPFNHLTIKPLPTASSLQRTIYQDWLNAEWPEPVSQ